MRTQKQKQGLGLSPRVVSAAPPRLTPLASAFRAEHGFTLIETILGVGVALVISAGVFTVYQHASRAGEVRKEQANISAIADQTAKAYSALGSFADLTTAQAISSHVVPKPMVNGTVLRSVWGSGVDLEPTGVQGQSNNALKIIYDAVPDYACAKLAAATAEGAWDILVNGVSVVTARRLDVSGAANLCSDEAVAKMEFTYYGGASGLASTVLTPIVLKPYVPPAPVVPPAPPAPVPAGPPAVTPPGVAAPPVAVTPPTIPPITTTPTAPPSATPPSAPPAVGPSCVEPASFNESGQQTGVCPGGKILSSGASTFNQSRTRTNSYACPDPWGTPVLNNGEWSEWIPSTASVCLPACVAPASTTRTETQQYSQSQTLSCQAGQTGSIAQTRVVTQSRNITTSYACSSPTGSAISNDSVGGWTDSSYGAWQTISDTCVTPAPPPPTGHAAGYQLWNCVISTSVTARYSICGLRVKAAEFGITRTPPLPNTGQMTVDVATSVCASGRAYIEAYDSVGVASLIGNGKCL